MLIAAVVLEHVHHEAAERAIARGEAPFATCPLTELALVRFLIREGTSAADAAEVLAHDGRLVTLDRGLAATHPDVADLVDVAGG